jgi:hypothetical protein
MVQIVGNARLNRSPLPNTGDSRSVYAGNSGVGKHSAISRLVLNSKAKFLNECTILPVANGELLYCAAQCWGSAYEESPLVTKTDGR